MDLAALRLALFPNGVGRHGVREMRAPFAGRSDKILAPTVQWPRDAGFHNVCFTR